jgi:hypothetical protein
MTTIAPIKPPRRRNVAFRLASGGAADFCDTGDGSNARNSRCGRSLLSSIACALSAMTFFLYCRRRAATSHKRSAVFRIRRMPNLRNGDGAGQLNEASMNTLFCPGD